MFKFEHLFVLDTKMTGVLLREIESDTLILALKGLEEEQREQFFGAMSSRAADGLRDEIEARGRVKKTEVEAAQKDIVTIAKRLIAENGARIDDAPLTDAGLMLDAAALVSPVKLSAGKKRHALVKLG